MVESRGGGRLASLPFTAGYLLLWTVAGVVPLAVFIGSRGVVAGMAASSLGKLALESPEKAELVKLRYFAGMSTHEAADALGISRATADRHWAYAKAFLYCALEDAGES